MENIKEMEAQRLPCPPVSDDQPVQVSCLQTIPAASNLSLSPVILQPEQALSQTIYLKALTIPFYQPVQSESLQRNSQLPTNQTGINLESSNVPLILSPLISSEWADQPQALAQKPPRTINIVSGLPILSQNSSSCASPGRIKSAGKYLCKHCGRDCLKPSVLEKHMRSHTGERPFPCTTCGIAFKTQSNLYKHRRTQTHVNNARLPSESDCSSPLEENEKITESVESPQTTKANDRNCVHNTRSATKAISESSSVIASEKHLLRTSLPSASTCSFVSESRWITTDSSYSGGANQNEKESMKDPADLLQRSKIQEQRSPTVNRHSQLQRQQATYLEKLWDSRSPDRKLKKCESTDSGYLSRSESVEQQMLSPSPLHSLYKHSTESEGETTGGMYGASMRCTTGSSSKMDLAEKTAATSTLEKKKLEEHISKLISQNKAVVDDSQLDNVRPRKTVLSKQGSIDLPMPYTYKDSFHFDIRALDTNRKKNLAFCSAKSIFTPVEKAKPLFFHSVPTQFSTTIDCVPVTRSNSLPFVESTRRMQEQVDTSKLSSFTRMAPNTSLSGLFHGNNFATGTTESPNSHPRALVRQVAVDDLPQSNVIESLPSVEEMKSPKKPSEGANTKGKKSGQKKLKMFSQEKWQVYGDETFKKIYQKMKSNQVAKKQKGNKTADASNLPSDIKETVICDASTVPRDGRSSISRNLVTSPVAISQKINSEESESHSISSPLSQSASSHESSSMGIRTASYTVCDSECSGLTKTLLDQRCQDLHVLEQEPSGNSQAVPLSTIGELRFQLCQSKGQERRTPFTAANLQRCSNELEEKCLPGELISASTGEDTRGKESSPLAQVAVPLHCSNSSELVRESQKLPSERKKLKVEEKAMLRVSLDPNNSAGRIVELLDHYKIINIAPVLSINHSAKGEKQAVVAGMNTLSSSMECEDATQHPVRPSSERGYSADDTGPSSVSTLSFSEHLRAEVTNEYICSSYTFQKVTEKTCSITEARMTSQCGAMTPAVSPVQPQVFDQVSPHPKRNEFLPKYILKYPKEGNTASMPLIIAGEQENISCISLPSTSTAAPYPSSNNRSLGTKATDMFLCPLQLELSHPIRKRELKWDVHTTWKPLVAYSPTILETTNITTRVDGRNAPQMARLEMKGAHNRDNADDEQPVLEGGGSAMVLSSLAPEKKICLRSMYAGGFLISSDITGQNSALQIIHSGSSSIISVSSLVERAAFCGNTDKEMKERDSDAKSFPRLQGLPSCSVANTRCLCHSTDMLYCHVLCTQQKDAHTLSRLSRVSCAGNPRIPSLTISFPTLNAEPRLTWCCLTKNLPLPVEQKEKEDSAYFSLHTCRNENAISKGSCSLCKLGKTRKAAGEGMTPGPSKTPTAFPQKQQVEKLNFPTARGDEVLENIVEQEKATLCKTKELATHKAKRSCKRRKVKINHKRFKGSSGHKHILLKTSRLSKQHWPTNRAVDMPKKHSSRPRRPGSHKCCGKCPCLPTASQGNDPTLTLQQEASCNIADKATFHVTKKNWMKEDVSKPTNEQSCGSLSLQGISVVSHMPTALFSSELPSSLDALSLGKVQKESWADTPSDHLFPSTGTSNFDFIDTGKTHPHQNLGSEVTSPIFAELKADCKNVSHVEPKCQSIAALKSPVPNTGRKKLTNEDPYPSLKQQLAPTFQTLCSVPLGSKMLPEPSTSSNSLLGLKHVEETSNSAANLECSDKDNSFVQPDDKEGGPNETELPAFKTSAPLGNCGILSKSYKNLSLEMMNKQTCVEYDDTSSDDEDRLIIEI